MMYEIKHKSDFQTGVTLITRIPEAETDKKALYTIIREQPGFLLPFRHRVIDGEIEFAYQIGSLGKFAYLQKNRSTDEYINLLLGILQPLIDCGDWFMSPYSFLLKTEYLYFDKNGKSVKFVYIPCKYPCSDYNDLKNMVTEIAKQNQITDVRLENKVVWGISDFKPDEFLHMLKSYKPEQIEKSEQSEQSETFSDFGSPKKSDDIDIKIFPNEKKVEKDEQNEKDEKDEKPVKKSFFDFIKTKKEKKEKKKQTPQEAAPASAVPNVEQVVPDDDLTQLVDSLDSGLARFRYFGSGTHPEIIEVDIAESGIFTIGRFDISAGVKQSDFEFEAKTKAVSRRHAAVEKTAEGYFLVDLSSSAGTFLDGQKLPPNAPFKLERGSRVSFGFSGADYIWEADATP